MILFVQWQIRIVTVGLRPTINIVAWRKDTFNDKWLVLDRYMINIIFNFVKDNYYYITWKISFVKVKKELKRKGLWNKIADIIEIKQIVIK